MSESNAPEPTMEEILASIRRIISEDDPPPEAVSAPPFIEPEPALASAFAAAPGLDSEADDVLELTERAPGHESASEPAPFGQLQSIGDLDVFPAEATAEPEPARAAAPAFHDEPLVSAPIAASTASVFGQLAQHIVMPKEGRTLEDVVRELLNPLLKAWLDEHLPAIVQAKVEQEVERIARRR